MYRVGVVDGPEDDDKELEELVDADAYAITLSFNDSVIAVWHVSEREEIVSLVYQQIVYTA